MAHQNPHICLPVVPITKELLAANSLEISFFSSPPFNDRYYNKKYEAGVEGEMGEFNFRFNAILRSR